MDWQNVCCFCLTSPASPLMLHCGHIMCQRCGLVCQQPINSDQKEITCYICQQKTTIQDLSDLQQVKIIDTQFDASINLNDNYIPQQDSCKIHQDEFTLYCVSCKTLCCVECVHNSSNHKKHSILSLKQALVLLHQENIQFLKKHKQTMKMIEDAQKICQRNETFLKNQKFYMQEFISSEIQKFISILKQREKEIIADLDAQISSQLQMNQEQQQCYITILSCFQQYKINQNSKDNDIQLYSLQQQLNKLLEENHNYPELLTNDNNIMDFSSQKEIIDGIQKFGLLIKRQAKSIQVFKRSVTPTKISQNPSNTFKKKPSNYQPLQKKASQKRVSISISNKENHRIEPITPVKPNEKAQQTEQPHLMSQILKGFKASEIENVIPSEYKRFKQITIQQFFENPPNQMLGLIQANNYRFGWYWNVSNIKKGYNKSDAYILTLTNCYNTLPMKFCIKYDRQDQSFTLLEEGIGFGLKFDGSYDLYINLVKPEMSHSSIGFSYIIVENLDGGKILAGSYNNWDVQLIELYQIE